MTRSETPPLSEIAFFAYLSCFFGINFVQSITHASLDAWHLDDTDANFLLNDSGPIIQALTWIATFSQQVKVDLFLIISMICLWKFTIV